MKFFRRQKKGHIRKRNQLLVYANVKMETAIEAGQADYGHSGIEIDLDRLSTKQRGALAKCLGPGEIVRDLIMDTWANNKRPTEENQIRAKDNRHRRTVTLPTATHDAVVEYLDGHDARLKAAQKLWDAKVAENHKLYEQFMNGGSLSVDAYNMLTEEERNTVDAEKIRREAEYLKEENRREMDKLRARIYVKNIESGALSVEASAANRRLQRAIDEHKEARTCAEKAVGEYDKSAAKVKVLVAKFDEMTKKQQRI